MGLFRKSKKDRAARKHARGKNTAAAAPEETPAPQPRAVKTAALTSGRMAALYRKLYLWIFSVNITADVYQIESGADSFGAQPLPIRGYYHDLLVRLQQEVLPEQREDFAAHFGVESLRAAVEAHKTSISALFCAAELGTEAPPEAQAESAAEAGEAAAEIPTAEEAPRALKWYEFSARWEEDVNPQNIIVVFSVRPVRDDLDRGALRRKESSIVCDAAGEIDWRVIRSEHLRSSSEGMDFEYNLAEDCWYLHRDGEEEARQTKRFTATVASRADFEVSHESVKALKQMLRARDGGIEECTILYRRNGVYGAPFHHYRMLAAPVMENGAPVWIVGRLEDIEEEFLRSEQNAEMAKEMSNMLGIFRISMFQINTQRDLLFAIEQGENGFRRQEKPQRLSDYIRKRVESGRIAPEAQEEYLHWLEPGYLQRKTMSAPYEYEARVKEPEDTDFRWYTETIVAVKGKPGQFVRWRRDDTEGHRARDAEYENKELAHIAEYNGQMLDAVASLVEFRSVESSNHIARMRFLTQILLDDLKKRSPQYGLTNREIFMYIQASTMHDIGKITVPDYILNKEGRYTPEEFEIMKKHTTDGAAIVDRLNMPGQEALKAVIRDVALHHHERYDGKGYPDGLLGDENHIGVQVVSLADVYDALVSERCYKKGFISDEALHMILEGECGEFNPCIIESLKACAMQLRDVYENDEEIRAKRS